MPSAIVIGAGPAGSTAGALLARAGWHVTLIEQHPFPRDKVCGECLSHLGHTVVTRLGVAEAIHNAGAVPLNRTWLHAPDGASAEIDLPDPMWGLSRRALDSILLDNAVRTGIRLSQPTRVEAVSIDPPAVTIRNLTTNTISNERADWILLADGRGSLLPNRPAATGDLGIKAHFEAVDSPRDAIELFGLNGHYLGLAVIEHGRSNVAYAVPARRLRDCHGNLDSLFADLRRENPTLDAKFRPARRVSDWLASPLPRFPVTSDWPPGIVPLGNAAAAMEPIGGEGMGLALRSAELAAHALIAAGTDHHHPSLRNLPAQYRRLWRTRRPACRAGAVVMSRPRLAATAVDLLRSVPGLAGPSLRLVGK
jgi:2-polyprenyl-6-methoxyphenol hydroxylase-like FAD-dependent oxidoreductase